MRSFKRCKREEEKSRTRHSIQQSPSADDVLVIDKVEAARRTRGLSHLVMVVSGGAQDSDGFRRLNARR
jgi:hypothetical protein